MSAWPNDHEDGTTVTQQPTAVFLRADDGRLMSRLRAVVDRRVGLTLFAGSQDPRAERLAAAVDAELGAIAPDTHLPVVLCPQGPPRHGIVGTQVLVVPDGQAGGWQSLFPDGSVGVALNAADAPAFEAALSAGIRLGPVGQPPAHPPVDLSGIRSVHVASGERTIADARLPQVVSAIRTAGADVEVRTVSEPTSRRARISAGWDLVRQAREDRPDVIHIHDAELLPPAVAAAARGITVVYDVHADLRAHARTRQWIPWPVRRPFAAFAGRVENMLAARVAAVLTDSKPAAIGFAARGARALGVDDPVGESAKIVALYGRLTGRID